MTPADGIGRPGEPFVLGVNYWPRRKAMSWWSDFDAGEVAADFDLIRSLGLRVVRIFLLWEDFQPAPDVVSAPALDELETVCDLAADRGLGLDITFFTGHMSGPNWVPPWLLDGGRPAADARPVVSNGEIVASSYRNPYVDGEAVAAQLLLVEAVVTRLRDHPAVWLWNLGNEPDLMALPPDHTSGPAWARRLVAAIREQDEAHPLTCGLHMASLVDDNGLRVDRIFETSDVAVMHAYPSYTDWAAGPLDPDLVPFACALTASLSGRAVLAEEFGACTAPPGQPSAIATYVTPAGPRRQFMTGEKDFADHLGLVLDRLVEVGAVGAMVWCFADYHPDLWDRPPCRESPHERFFGLVRGDGSLKPHADVLRAFAATGPTIREPPPWARLAVDPTAFYQNPMENIPALYERFRERETGESD